MTKVTLYHVQWGVTPKVGKPQLWSLCSVCYLMVVNISVKVLKIITNGFQITG